MSTTTGTRTEEATAAPSSQAAARAAKRPPRLAYGRGDVSVRATHPGGGTTAVTAYAHDLSTGAWPCSSRGTSTSARH